MSKNSHGNVCVCFKSGLIDQTVDTERRNKRKKNKGIRYSDSKTMNISELPYKI